MVLFCDPKEMILIAIIEPKEDVLKEEKTLSNLEKFFYSELNKIAKENSFQTYQHIVHCIVEDKERWEIENGFLNVSFKIKKNFVYEKYEKNISKIIENYKNFQKNLLNFVDKTDGNKSFSSLGKNSLEAVNLVNMLKKNQINVTPTQLLDDNNSILDIFQLSQNNQHLPSSQENISKDILLPKEIEYKQSSENKMKKENKKIFMTGVTGYIGSFLLHHILNNTSWEVYLLVRSEKNDEKTLMERVINSLNHFSLKINSDQLQKIRPVFGDLKSEKLGVTEEDYLFLIKNIDSIVHLGANVNLIRDYNSLRENVLSTKTIIKDYLAKDSIKHFHYFSTTDVLNHNMKNDENFFDFSIEDDFFKNSSGYVQTKLVCENLIKQIKERNFPVTVYRLGLIGSSQSTGVCSGNDFYSVLLKGFQKMEKFPITNNENFFPNGKKIIKK